MSGLLMLTKANSSKHAGFRLYANSLGYPASRVDLLLGGGTSTPLGVVRSVVQL